VEVRSKSIHEICSKQGRKISGKFYVSKNVKADFRAFEVAKTPN